MAIKRYYAVKDNTITNAFKENLTTRATGSNMGASDILEIYSIYARQATGSSELARFLIEFDLTGSANTPKSDRDDGLLAASGSVKWYLRVFNAKHSRTVPREYYLMVSPISKQWEEGTGLDMDEYTDLVGGNKGSNWVQAASGSGGGDTWSTQGGDYLTFASYPHYVVSQSFETGLEDMEIEVSDLVEAWIAGTVNNFGMGVQLSKSYEAYDSSTNTEGQFRSYYTKKFFGRGTQYFFKRPVLEARWDNSRRDHRGDFRYSSSLAPAVDNLNTLYLYNRIRGRLVNIPSIGTGQIFVSVYSGSTDNSEPTGSYDNMRLKLSSTGTAPAVGSENNYVVTGGYISTGVYTASFAMTASATPLTKLFDVWHSGTTQFFTGTISPELHTAQSRNEAREFITTVKNIKSVYRSDQTARFRVFTREKDWCPTVYNVASREIEHATVQSSSFSVVRTIDNMEIIPHATGSLQYTMMSYDVSGSYFDLDMSLLEPQYTYGIKVAYYDELLAQWVEQSELFKFRVESNER